MPGMPTAAHDGGPALHLLPAWLGVAWAAVFVVISVSHLRHMVQTTGQRRPWHACHVLMALGMAFMFLPSNVDPLAIPAGFWKLTFATAGLIAAVWALGGVGRTATIIWLLTSIDLGAMLYMWSGAGRPGDAAVTWMLSGYLVGEALAWGLDLYRRIDGGAPLVSWQQLALDSGGGPATGSRGRGGGVRVGSTVVAAAEDARSLLGTLDISASMVMMTIGMAYMLVATALGT